MMMQKESLPFGTGSFVHYYRDGPDGDPAWLRPAALLALFANGLVAKQDLSAEVILSGALSGGWLAGHNASTMLTESKRHSLSKRPSSGLSMSACRRLPKTS